MPFTTLEKFDNSLHRVCIPAWNTWNTGKTGKQTFFKGSGEKTGNLYCVH